MTQMQWLCRNSGSTFLIFYRMCKQFAGRICFQSCLSVILSVYLFTGRVPMWPHMNIFKPVYLGTPRPQPQSSSLTYPQGTPFPMPNPQPQPPRDMFKHVPSGLPPEVAHTSIGKRAVGLQLKGLLVRNLCLVHSRQESWGLRCGSMGAALPLTLVFEAPKLSIFRPYLIFLYFFASVCSA